MSTPMLEPNFESLSAGTQDNLKADLDAILGRKVSVEKVEEAYEVFAGAYRRWVLNRRKAAAKKAAKKNR